MFFVVVIFPISLSLAIFSLRVSVLFSFSIMLLSAWIGISVVFIVVIFPTSLSLAILSLRVSVLFPADDYHLLVRLG